MAVARTVRIALLLCSVASGLRKSRRQNGTEVESDAPDGLLCLTSWPIRTAVKSLTNLIAPRILRNFDPLSKDMGTISREKRLIGCPVNMSYNVSMNIRDFTAARVGRIECDRGECVEHSTLGRCRKEHYEFTVRVGYGDDVVKVDGVANGNWDFCGLRNSPRRVDMGFEAAGAAVEFTVKVEYTKSLISKAQVIGVSGVHVQFGRYQNFNCGFSTLPGLIGGPLESWCSNFGDWMLEKTETHLRGPLNNAINDLLNRFLDLPEEPEQLEDA